ncbi:hypothetical protein ACN23B_27510 (plasmid) [Anabaena sp. FACHB-709]|uniref:Uncharacterized protein n=1 Tax=Trichormus variabilis NIES-23 TaxID=1973479 RepID=A0A1Z4KUI7_ANAVA|nr:MULTISPECIES: hypothetical protein [Nostocaceae]BAY72705.1 hypothetical protein NIES23_55330 [Trichormus variabilis NIES-23]MBD2267189.1 hypothetical protein [Anabaena sp. FACHB-709]MBD2276751.1 hypothetical protein [Nostoc sp. PCC 7120 = FACHB-418]MBD2352913.1 hypothetical protein [Trichormus variabilis FACHB-171]RUR72022.1 hypothetical protein DSM107007_58670 [Nostoc sp. PCC 7120 = FACHB-418]
MNIFVHIFGKFRVRKHSHDILLIHQDAGLAFWLFFLTYFGVVIFINSLLAVMLWEANLPRTLTCWRQQQTTTCNYRVPGIINGKTIKITDVKNAISSQSVNQQNIVLTSSKPWIVLESTSNNFENIKFINQGLGRLNSGNKTWEMNLYASANLSKFIMFFLLPVGLLLFILGLIIIVNQRYNTLEIDANANTVTIIKLGRFRSQLSLFTQLIAADTQIVGHLGILSEKFGIYGGDVYNRRRNYQNIRLLFANRRPFIFHQQKFARDGSGEVVTAINSFISEHKP